MYYRKKPILVEARQFDGTYKSGSEISEWAGTYKQGGVVKQKVYLGHYSKDLNTCAVLEIETLEGSVICTPGNWVVKGVENEVWPIKNSIFEKTYEVVSS